MIKEFQGKYRFLSNFYPAKVKDYFDIVYPSTEHAFQAAKTLDRDERQKIANMSAPGETKRYGKTVKLRPDWETIKLQVMYDLNKQKYERYPELMRALIMTDPEPLQEGNLWYDFYWGINLRTNTGENHLGKILMRIRQEIKENIIHSNPLHKKCPSCGHEEDVYGATLFMDDDDIDKCHIIFGSIADFCTKCNKGW